MPDWLHHYPDFDRVSSEAADWWPSAPDGASAEDLKRMKHVMRRLSTRDVLILQLYAQGLEKEEIGRRVGLSRPAVFQRIEENLTYLRQLARLPYDPTEDEVHAAVLNGWAQAELPGSPVKAARILSTWWVCHSQRATAALCGVSKSGVQKYLTRLLTARHLTGDLVQLRESAVVLNALDRRRAAEADDEAVGVRR